MAVGLNLNFPWKDLKSNRARHSHHIWHTYQPLILDTAGATNMLSLLILLLRISYSLIIPESTFQLTTTSDRSLAKLITTSSRYHQNINGLNFPIIFPDRFVCTRYNMNINLPFWNGLMCVTLSIVKIKIAWRPQLYTVIHWFKPLHMWRCKGWYEYVYIHKLI